MIQYILQIILCDNGVSKDVIFSKNDYVNIVKMYAPI